MSDLPLLDVRTLGANYGPYRALFDVSFSVEAGSAVALVGANGAGKSTVARAITGLLPGTTGSVLFNGNEIARRSIHSIARMGMSHVTEGRSVFASLSVEENLTLSFRQALGRKAVSSALDRAFSAFGVLGNRRSQLAGTLSGGEQRMLALARALVLPQKLLVVDELSFGLAPVVVDEVYAALTQVLATGTALLIIEQHVDRSLELADAVVVLARGRVVYDGSVEGVRPQLTELILGGGGQ